MSALFVRAVSRANPLLFQLLVRFNQRPATTLHDNYLPNDLAPEMFRRVVRSTRGERRLSAWVTERYQLSPEGFWRFEYPPQRLALFDSEPLQRLVMLAGAAMHFPQVSGLIGGAQIRDVKQGLGEPTYQFALKRAPLLVGALASSAPSAAVSEPLVATIQRTGLSCLKTCLGADSPELLKRMSLKLPKEMAVSVETPAVAIERERCWKLVRRILVTEINPELARCFD